jgi:hypothetical protein
MDHPQTGGKKAVLMPGDEGGPGRAFPTPDCLNQFQVNGFVVAGQVGLVGRGWGQRKGL